MEGAIKHGVWALSLGACVYFATTHGWTPIRVSIAPQAISAGESRPAAPPPSTASDDAARLLAAAQLIAGSRAPNQASAANPLPTSAGTVPGAQPSLDASAIPTASFAMVEDAGVARKVRETLARLEAVADVPPGTPEERVATIFFDPRCPYCHAAFTALRGKVAARWVPVVVLGEPEAGNRMAAAILAAPDRVAALAETFRTKMAPTAPVAPEMLARLVENREAFASVFAASPSLRPGVPTLFVPRPDGRLAIMVGYESGDDAKLASLLTGS